MTRKCTHPGCDEKHYGKGFCSTHYRRNKYGTPMDGPDRSLKMCQIDGCDKAAKKRGYCETHYLRWRKGDRGESLSRDVRRIYSDNDVCSVDGCKRKPKSRGMCQKHYHAYLVEQNIVKKKTCEHDGCDKFVHKGGLCWGHWNRKRSGFKGDPSTPVGDTKRRECAVPECSETTQAMHGLCASHYRLARRQARTKYLIDILGGKCEMCGGEFPIASFEFHHRDPSQKLFTIADKLGVANAWDLVVSEAKKCALLCSNCHRQLHAKEDVTQYVDNKCGRVRLC